MHHDFVQFAMAQSVPEETLYLLLTLPFIVFFVAFLRQVVGIKAFGIYTPTLITFAFLIAGVKYAAALFIIVIAVALLNRLLLSKIRLLYFPRVAITLTLISLVVLFMLTIGGSFQRTGFAAAAIAPVIIMIVLAEKFIASQMEKGTKTALLMAGETFIIALVISFIVSLPFMYTLLLSYPWIVLFTLPLNFLLGKWTGLRLSEYYRFRTLLEKK